ncbi:exosortase N [Pedobacter metabolipauper]|uniref:Exosortase N n=1 Tax=Pedobacter metabolipauper TaxID=425513 RepID=A0A4R6SUA4_9SPHI|nr:exosortase N [Pedobacter metabolipauper]
MYLIIGLILLKFYLTWNISLIIGLIMIPFVCRVEKGVLSTRFIIPALVFAVLAIFISAKSTVFFALLFTSLLLFESFKGKISLTFFFVIVLISPLFKFFSDTLSFPLRLWLSDIVAKTIALGGSYSESAGNIIKIDGYDFYIDQACAGLNMLNISLLIAIFILSFYQKKLNASLSFFGIVSVMTGTFLLNLISNYFRILLIVLFKIMPGTAMHDLVGIFSLFVYVILPLTLLTEPVIKKFGKVQIPENKERQYRGFKPEFKIPAVHLLLFISIMYSAITYKTRLYSYPNEKSLTLEGFQKTILDSKVLKFENSKALIYMKPSVFYSPEHNPMICWTGSGYEFKFIKKEFCKGKEIYTGTLVKGTDKLYASWWFDNGKIKTIDQINWRWNSAKGSNFYLINVTAAKKSDLKRITEELLPSPFAGNL